MSAISAARVRLLLLPGLDNSGPAHWQTLWEVKQPFLPVASIDRIVRQSWSEPVYEVWQEELQQTLQNDLRPTIIIAHSLGCLSAAGVDALANPHLKAALLVAPPNANRPDFPTRIKNFRVPARTLSFPSIFVASENDPYASFDSSQQLAKVLGSKFISVGPAGHVNGDSGLGDWMFGQERVHDLIKDVLHKSGA